jgi:DNA polymerase I
MTNVNKKLFLIDGSALAYRSHFAFFRNPLLNSKGQNVSAVYGFMNAMLRLILREKPQYLAVIMDSKEKTFRHHQFEAYKANREKMPDELALQFPMIYDILKSLNIPVLAKPGLEADDIIGAMSIKAAAEGVNVDIITGDKDFAQLITDKIHVVNPKDDAIWTPEYVEEKWGIKPEFIIEYLGLIGDSADNVPGVPGVGPKTALKLLLEYTTIANLYENIDLVKNARLKEKLIENKELAFLSRELVTIKTDFKTEIEWHEAVAKAPNTVAVKEYFQNLDFHQLGKLVDKVSELYGDTENIPMLKVDKNYSTVLKYSDIEDVLKVINEKELVSFDFETTSLDIRNAKIVGVALSWEKDQGVYLPFRAPEIPQVDWQNREIDILKMLDPFFLNENCAKTGQNLKYDLGVLDNYNIKVNNVHFDTLLAAYLVNPGSRQLKLEELSLHYLHYEMQPITDLIGKGKLQLSMEMVPLEKISYYAAEDADIALQLTHILKAELDEKDITNVLEDIELPLMHVLRKMEGNGTYIDTKMLNEMSDEFLVQMDELEVKIYKEAGEIFNINSTQQLATILFEKMEIPPVKKTKTGFSTDVYVLERLSQKYALPKLILDYRKFAKLKSTYTDALPLMVHRKTGRIHSNFNQTIASTGRLSSTDPNFQNIPIRTDLGREIRKAFVPQAKDSLILSADYSQVELRLMAHFSQDEPLIKAFNANEDVHSATASKVFSVPLEEVTSDMRRKAKVVNFGIMYGAGPFRLGNELNINRNDALELIHQYFKSYPGIKNYIDSTLEFARQNKYVETLIGRRRYVPEIDASNKMTREGAERVATNMPIQGTAADIIKIAMIDIDKALDAQNLASKMILQVHDELVFEVLPDELETVRTIVKDKMENVIQLSIPLKVDMGVGQNWLEAH